MSTLLFDIETGPQPLDVLLANSPFVAPPPPGEFDEKAVKLGNLKDAAKIAEKIAAAKAEHEYKVGMYDADCALKLACYKDDLLEKAALDPTTGVVLAIGYSDGTKHVADINDEVTLLHRFWRKWVECKSTGRTMAGWNIEGFDLPFLVRRSWIHSIDIPAGVRDGRYWHKSFRDFRNDWLLGQRWGDCESKLDHVSRVLGVGSKPEGVNGGDFARLFGGNDAERAQAIAYLLNDLALTAKVAMRLGAM